MFALIDALGRQDTLAATANMEHQLEKKVSRIEDLVKEGNARALTSRTIPVE